MSSGATIQVLKQSPDHHFSKGPFLRSHRGSGKRIWRKPSLLSWKTKSSSESEEEGEKTVSFGNKDGGYGVQKEEGKEKEVDERSHPAMRPSTTLNDNGQRKIGEALRPALEELPNGSHGRFNAPPPVPPHKHLFTDDTKNNEALPLAAANDVVPVNHEKKHVAPEARPVGKQLERAPSTKKESPTSHRSHRLLQPGARERGTSFANIRLVQEQEKEKETQVQKKSEDRREWRPDQRYREPPPWEQERHRRPPYPQSHTDGPPWRESNQFRPPHPTPQHHRRDQDDHTITRPPPPPRPYAPWEDYPPSRPSSRPYPARPQRTQPREETESWVQSYYTSQNKDAWRSDPVRRPEFKKPRPPTADALWAGGVASKRRNNYQTPRHQPSRHADLFPEAKKPWHKLRGQKTDPDESILVTNGIVSHAFPDWMWAGVYYDAGLCRYHMCGTATALRHIMLDNDRSSVMEEQLARHATEMDLHGRGYVDPSPKARGPRRVNGLLIPPLEQRLLPPEQRPVWDEMGNAHSPASQNTQDSRAYSQGQHARSFGPLEEQWPPPRPPMQQLQSHGHPQRPRRPPQRPPPPPDAFNNPRGPTHGITHKYPPINDFEGFYQPQSSRRELPQSNGHLRRPDGAAHGESEGRGKERVGDVANDWSQPPRHLQNACTRPPNDPHDEPNWPLSNGNIVHTSDGSRTNRQSDSSSTLVRWKEDIQGAIVNRKLSWTRSQENEEYEMQPVRNGKVIGNKFQNGSRKDVHRVRGRPDNTPAYSDDVENWG